MRIGLVCSASRSDAAKIHTFCHTQTRDGDVILNEGEMIVVPHGVEHCPDADKETHVVLFERNTTLNTGNVRNEKTVAELDRL